MDGIPNTRFLNGFDYTSISVVGLFLFYFFTVFKRIDDVRFVTIDVNYLIICCLPST